MPIEFKCSHCLSTLRVADEHLGKHARCPNCQTLNRVQPEGPPPAVAETLPSHPTDLPFSEVDKNPFVSPHPHAPLGRTPGYGRPKPHRGAIVLTLGIMSLICCNPLLILGIMAWVMGRNDLIEMKQGVMDRSGEGMTRAGMILGIVMTVVGVLYIASVLFG